MTSVEQTFLCTVTDADTQVHGWFHRMRVTLAYDPAEPFEVRLVFHDPGEDIPWVFARSMLADGLERPVGHGDVMVLPMVGDSGHLESVLIAVSVDRDSATACLPAGGVRAFLDRAHTAVAAGAECIDLDVELARLFGATP